MPKGVTVGYSEDFRENKIAGKVYGLLRDNGFHPHGVALRHTSSVGITIVHYVFNSGERLPEKSQLERMLKEIKLISMEIQE